MQFDIAGAIRYGLLEIVVPLIFALSFVVFVWGAFLYFIAGTHDEAGKEKGKSIMLYGILVYAGMFAVWLAAEFIVSFIPA